MERNYIWGTFSQKEKKMFEIYLRQQKINFREIPCSFGWQLEITMTEETRKDLEEFLKLLEGSVEFDNFILETPDPIYK